MARRVKNDVSYFLAGYKAGLLASRSFNKQEVQDAFYSSLFHPNKSREYLRVYDTVEDYEEADNLMLDYIAKDLKRADKRAIKSFNKMLKHKERYFKTFTK